MFDIGGWEFLIIIVVAVIIVGPKDLPGVVKTASEWIRRARGLAREFQSGMEDLAREVELEKIGDDVKKGIGLDDAGDSFRREIENSIDPKGEISDAFSGTGNLQDEDVLDDELLYDDEYNDPIDVDDRKPKPQDKKVGDKNVIDEKRNEGTPQRIEGTPEKDTPSPTEPAESASKTDPDKSPVTRGS